MSRLLEKSSLFLAHFIHRALSACGTLRAAFRQTRCCLSSLLRALLFRREAERGRFAVSTIHRFVCAVMVMVMPAQMVVASPQISHSVAETVSLRTINGWQQVDHWWASSGWEERTERFVRENLPFLRTATPQRKGWDGRGAPAGERMPEPRPQESQAERHARVVRVEVIPDEVTVRPDQPVEFIVIGYDSNNAPVSSLSFELSGEDEKTGEQVNVAGKGKFAASREGEYRVKVNALGHQAEARVSVKAAPQALSDRPVVPYTYSSREVAPAPRSTSSVQPKSGRTGRQRGKIAGGWASRYAASGTKLMAAIAQSGDQYGWNDGNAGTADNPGSRRGTPAGEPPDGGAGNSNYQFTAPVLAVEGRGLDLDLGMYYNSRVWHKAGFVVTHDIDRDWPAPGWEFGFSKIVGMGEQSGYMIMEANGTRRPYTCTITPQQPIGFADCKTTDGSFIDYHVEANFPGGKPISARMVLSNGTVITMDSANPYGSGPNAVYPQNIQDSHGNRINIAYVPHSFPYGGEPKLRYVIDTMGKVIQFYYDANNLPVAVTAPGLDGTRRTVVRITYEWKNKSSLGSFANLVPLVRGNTFPVVKGIYYPESQTGWWFGDTDSYSAYGMIAKVVNQRGMGFSGAALPADSLQPADMGTITPGVMTHQLVYDYPMVSSGLRDEPRYQTMTETWAHMDEAPAVTRYLVQEDATPRRTEMTRPDGVKMVMLSHNAPGDFKDGRVYQNETYSPQGALLSRSYIEWEEGNCSQPGQAPGQYEYCAPRVSRIETTDELGRKTGKEFSYGSLFNQVEEARLYGYGYKFDGAKTLLRKTKTEYMNDGKYIDYQQRAYGSHIYNLVAASEVYAGDGTTRLSRVEYSYDENTGTEGLKNAPGITTDGYNDFFNPHTNPTSESTWSRGDVTAVKRYAKAATLEAGSAISETMNYDVTGNVVKVVPQCCGQTTINYTANTQYAWPESVTSGSASEETKQNTSSSTYDFNTGLVKTVTDANGRTSQYQYIPGTTRPLKEIGPTGAYTYHEYDDAGLKVMDFAYRAGESEGDFSSRSDKYLNGQGGVRLAIAYGKDDVQDQVAIKYDQMRRVKQQSRPYRSGETPQWSTVTYDYLDRPMKTTSPDLSEMTRAYNQGEEPEGASGEAGQTVRVTDAWGRERWALSDALGRLVKVIEPKADGDGKVNTDGMVTTYKYDDLDRLIEVRQGEQIRRFRHNSFGQITHQKLAEQAGTLNDAGEYVETGQWSSVFKYDPRTSLMIESVDARGVKTKFDYDDDVFDRLQKMSYDKSGVLGSLVGTIPDAASVEYFYMTTGDVTRVRSMVVGSGMGNETMSYDSEGRLSEVRRTFAGRGSYPLVMNYEWNTLGQLTAMTYPAQYGAGDMRKKVEYTYDKASRMESLKFGGVTFASEPVYNAADQMASLKMGSQIVENYGYDVKTGLLTTQDVVRGGTDKLVDLKYNYTLTNAANNNGAKTGQLTGIEDLKNPARNRIHVYDNLGRLKSVSGGTNAFTSPDWSQSYAYDRFGNKLGVTKSGNAPQIPLDGMGSVSVNPETNRITSAGFAYDDGGNQTKVVIDGSGTQQQSQYDAAGRLVKVLDGSGTTVVASYSYGAGNQRLMSVEGGVTRYYGWGEGGIICEYEAAGASGLQWKTSYVYLGGQLMATTSGSDGSETRFHHPDRLSGTRLVTDAANGEVVAEQLSLPYGTMQPYGAYGGDNSYRHATKSNPSRKRFTSYDLDDATGMHYAVNRYYSSRQGRFTQVDPIGMGSVELANPQSLNLYAYVEGDPVNSRDPLGLDGLSFSFGGPYPTGGGGGGWWNSLLSFGPFTFSFGFGSGFGGPFIPWFPLPMNRMLLLQQQLGIQPTYMAKPQEPKPLLPLLQEPPTAQSIVTKSGSGGQEGTSNGRRRPSWEELDRLLNPTDEDYKRIWLERFPSHDGMVPDPTQPPISQWIYGRRMVHYSQIATEDYKYGFIRFEPSVPGGGVGIGMAKKADIKWIKWVVKKIGLSKDQKRILHDTITGENLTKEEIKQIAEEIKKNFPNK